MGEDLHKSQVFAHLSTNAVFLASCNQKFSRVRIRVSEIFRIFVAKVLKKENWLHHLRQNLP